ncbi:MAG: heparan-alpha-glucosaminide N-acetyltransferase domain-containing protein, partial [Acidobacteriota bacterium]|nr:heparan-alpha-glucosaminide N-acetyltransferase domain-containing protein [Acidobacteriota bacterium]
MPEHPTAPKRPRIWEIDFLRGLSILLMVGYHLLYDLGAFVGLKRFLGFSTDLFSPAWMIAQYFFA